MPERRGDGGRGQAATATRRSGTGARTASAGSRQCRTPALISHQSLTAAADTGPLTALRSAGLLDIVGAAPCDRPDPGATIQGRPYSSCGGLGGTPCHQPRLRRLVTKTREKCRLAFIALLFWLPGPRLENSSAAAALVAASGYQAPALHSERPTESSPERRALDYLSREVPRWSAENHCYSCHNNGDGARALYTARGLGDSISAAAIDDTTAWLSRPDRWNEPGNLAGFGDTKLARLQFASALAAALEAGALQDPGILSQAAAMLAADQEADGSWRVGAEGLLGSPVTYGTCLATYMARRILARTDQVQFAGAIERADQWLARANLSAVIDAAAVALALRDHPELAATASAEGALDLIVGAQGSEGGWGPYRNSPAEAFDTAMALLALTTRPERGAGAQAIRRGRAYLVSIQLSSGGWTGTTRPPGAQSYAQHISTSAWATMALLLTR